MEPQTLIGGDKLTNEAKNFLRKQHRKEGHVGFDMNHLKGVDEIEKADIMGEDRFLDPYQDSTATERLERESRPTTASSLLSRLLRESSGLEAGFSSSYQPTNRTNRSYPSLHSNRNVISVDHNLSSIKIPNSGTIVRNAGKHISQPKSPQTKSPIRKKKKPLGSMKGRKKDTVGFKRRTAGSSRADEIVNVIWRPPIKVEIANDLTEETKNRLLQVEKSHKDLVGTPTERSMHGDLEEGTS